MQEYEARKLAAGRSSVSGIPGAAAARRLPLLAALLPGSVPHTLLRVSQCL